MRKNISNYFLIAALAVVCWGGLFSLRGIWWDDWAWVWHFYSTQNLGEFLVPFKNLHKQLEGVLLYVFFKQFGILHYNATLLWSVIRFLLFTANSLLVYAIAKTMDTNTKLPEITAAVYLVSPVVNNLCLVTTVYHVELFAFFVSIFFSLKSLEQDRLNVRYYLFSVILSGWTMISLGSYVFFDVVRATLVFALVSGKRNMPWRRALVKTALFWLPFLIIGAGVLVYFRTHPQTGAYAGVYKTQALTASYLNLIIARYTLTFSYMMNAAFLASVNKTWIQTHILYLLPVFAVITYFFVIRSGENYNGSKSLRMLAYCAFGAAVSIIGYFPYALVREAAVFGLDSRHAALANVGLAVFLGSLTAFLYYLSKVTRVIASVVLSLIIVSGVLECRAAVKAYSLDWEQQKTFWARFVSAVPDLKEKAFLLVDMPRKQAKYFDYWRGTYEFSAPLNILYAKSDDISEMHRYYAESIAVCRYDDIRGAKSVDFLSYSGKTQIYYPGNLVYASFCDNTLLINKAYYNAREKPAYFSRAVKDSSSKMILKQPPLPAGFKFRWIIGL